MDIEPLASSFRDPSGFLFESDGKILRQVNASYAEHYDALMSSGLYHELTSERLLISHVEVESQPEAGAYKTLEPDQLRYVSYPYEWSFSQLKDAAQLTLEIQRRALARGMTLKDASAYNIQFHEGRPVFIDTLSFERYQEGQPWLAYRQFCQHFLAPLALISNIDHQLSTLLRSFIDGIPLGLTSRLLPRSTWLKYSLLAHVHLHARSQQKYEDSASQADMKTSAGLSRRQLEGLIASLHGAITGLRWSPGMTEWGGYYAETNYADTSMQHKESLVDQFLRQCQHPAGSIAADFGANNGRFSRLAADRGYFVLAYDVDPLAVEQHYLQLKEDSRADILPLVQDFTNPSPALGWANRERWSFTERYAADVVLALALIHHLHISNNVPLKKIAALLAASCEYLIVEFVPKSDSQVRRLLATREDIFPEYNESGFEDAFGRFFDIVERVKIEESERTLYFLKKS